MILGVILTMAGLVLALTACGLSCVTFLRHDEDLTTVRKRQIAVVALLLTAAVMYVASGRGYLVALMWFLLAMGGVQQIPNKRKAARQRRKREAKLAAQRAAELERSNAEADDLAAELGLKPMPRIPEQQPLPPEGHNGGRAADRGRPSHGQQP